MTRLSSIAFTKSCVHFPASQKQKPCLAIYCSLEAQVFWERNSSGNVWSKAPAIYGALCVEKAMNMLSCGNNPRLLIDGIRKRKVQSDQQGAREKKDQILDFYARRMQLSIPCHNRKELAEISHHYDALVCGSDQIWNPVWMNPAYFLDFAEPEKTRIAYAPSLGISTEPGRLKRKKIRQLTALFDAISVREEEGARLMVTISGKRPPVMPDPVCLLTKAEWEEILPTQIPAIGRYHSCCPLVDLLPLGIPCLCMAGRDAS